ncbi:MAG: DUF1987 domain-containing protein [Bacteroidia bacterium]
METLIVNGTEKTPEVNFNFKEGKLYIGGRSYASDTYEFYSPLITWVNEYTTKPKDITILEIKLDYFHSVSVKYLTNIIKKLILLREVNKSLKIVWLYTEEDDDEACDLGKNIERELNVKFEFVQVPE